jgi:ATP-binding cassette subfamily B protein
MIAGYHGKEYSLNELREKSRITKRGVSFLGLYDAAESIGLEPTGVKVTFEQLIKEVPKPCIVHWEKRHFIVVSSIKRNVVKVADPALGLVRYPVRQFKNGWLSTTYNEEPIGFVLIFNPTQKLLEDQPVPLDSKVSLKFILDYFNPYRRELYRVFLFLLIGSGALLLLPFLSKAIVDKGLGNDNLSFISLLLIAQLLLVLGKTGLEYIRSWLILHMTSRINYQLLSDYLTKLLKLPISFYETKRTGDILQRIGDHSRIETFFTHSGLSFLFSLVNIVVLCIALCCYSLIILMVFIVCGCLYLVWIRLFLSKRAELDHNRFQEHSENQNLLIQLISGVSEIQINNCQRSKKRIWGAIQNRTLNTKLASLALTQSTHSGSVLINEIRNLLITFLAANYVINGQVTLGEMFAIQFIAGQLIGPVEQVVTFTYGLQDAKLSLERLSEVHAFPADSDRKPTAISIIPCDKTFKVKEVSFHYEGPRSPKVLDNITMEIPAKKVTAIVGASGSGKTTLIKLLMGIYQPSLGVISLGDIPIHLLDPELYRSSFGAVMQNGYLFSDSIASNICLSDEPIDSTRLFDAGRIANVEEFLKNNPLGYNTEIGLEGMGLSQGQKQRILIARAVYKSPEILFFDEATNSLDADNEKIIQTNLQPFYMGRTVVIVAHRLSTVMNADRIFVLDKGRLVETGTHGSLVNSRGVYYNLVKNQIELRL